MADIYIGNVKGPQGDTGATGPQGAAGAAATVQVGTVSTTAYGNPAQVTNSGTEHAAVLNFTIPQGAPGATVTQLDNLALNTITTSTDQYPQIQVGDLGRVIFGKIIKFFQDLVTGLAAKINYSDALTMEEIEAASDLTDKVSAAAASKTLKESLSTKTIAASDVFTPSAGWTLNSASYVKYDDYGNVEVYLHMTASPVATTGGRYTLGTFSKYHPNSLIYSTAPTARVNNGALTDIVPVIFGYQPQFDNYTGQDVANIGIHLSYFTTNI